MKKKNSKRMLGWIIGLAVVFAFGFFLLAAGAVGFYFYTDHFYSQAVSSVENQDYKTAVDDLTKVVSIYKDAPKLMTYAQAGDELKSGQYDAARSFYSSLGDYKDSETMLLEVDYQQASNALTGGKLDEAEKSFKTLLQKNYKDSAAKLSETEYQIASGLLNAKNYSRAEGLLQALARKQYKDSESLLKEAEFNVAVGYYEAKEYDKAKDLFTSVSSYQNSSDYLFLIQLNQTTYDRTNYTQMESLYKRLSGLYQLEDAATLIQSDEFIYYWLEGTWNTDKAYSYDFKLEYQGTDKGFIETDNMPTLDGKYYKIEGGICYLGSNADGWKPNFKFIFKTNTYMGIYCYTNGDTYYLNKKA